MEQDKYRDEPKPLPDSEVVTRGELGYGDKPSTVISQKLVDAAYKIDTERLEAVADGLNELGAEGRVQKLEPLDSESPLAKAFEERIPDSKAADDAETARRRVRLNFRLQPAEMLTGEDSLRVQLDSKTKEAAALKEALLAKTEEVEEMRAAFQDSEADVEKFRTTLLEIADAMPSQDPIAMARKTLNWSTR